MRTAVCSGRDRHNFGKKIPGGTGENVGIKNISKMVNIDGVSWVSTFAESLVTMQTFCLLPMPVIIKCTGFMVTGPFQPNDRTFWETVKNEEITPADHSPGPWCCGGTPWGRGSAWTPAGGKKYRRDKWDLVGPIGRLGNTTNLDDQGGGGPASGCQKGCWLTLEGLGQPGQNFPNKAIMGTKENKHELSAPAASNISFFHHLT